MGEAKRVSRRQFARRGGQLGAAAWAGFHYVAADVLGAEGHTPASDRIGLGHIGYGRRGTQLRGLPGGQVVAIADVNQKRLAAAEGQKLKGFRDYRRLLDLKEVDAVVVATPDHWHAPNALHAVQAGKDVYCEKPLTLTVREGRELVEAVRRYGRVLQTGSQWRSMPGCRLGCELVRNGRAGRIHTVHAHNFPSPWEPELPAEPVPPEIDWELWLGPSPFHPYNVNIYLPRAKPGWISFTPWSGGELTGNGSHGLDMVQWALGTDTTGPVEVWADGPRINSVVHYRYANGVVMHLDQGGYVVGGIFQGDRGEIRLDGTKVTCLPEAIGREPVRPDDIRLYESNNHFANWGECMRTRARPIADVEIGHRSATLCHLGNIARWLAPRRLKWDPDAETFPDDPEAARYLSRPRREPYRL
ncbi:MAG TPA: Gfo/Idh/MocA family oxidoreductase [Planctomycetota bacterium]|nr:Gfo/Idh/MocA family oxidoreductase [Planctomycetota bacterium]